MAVTGWLLTCHPILSHTTWERFLCQNLDSHSHTNTSAPFNQNKDVALENNNVKQKEVNLISQILYQQIDISADGIYEWSDEWAMLDTKRDNAKNV